MGGRKGKKNARKTVKQSEKPAASPPQAREEPPQTPQTPKRAEKATLLLADPATPVRAVMSQNVLTPELQRSMEKSDIADVLAAADMMPTVQTREAAAIIDKQAALLDATFRRIKEEERTLEKRLTAVTEQVGVLKQKWEEGKISMTRQRYTAQIEKSLRLQQDLMSRLSLLWTKGAALAGSWTSDMITTGIKRDAAEDWTLIDAVLRCYPELEEARRTIKSRRTEQQQVLFRKKLIGRYEGGPTGTDVRIYCPITHGRVHPGEIRAAHVVDVNVGAKTMASLFGEDEDHLWNPKNGLLLFEGFKKLIDEAKAVILPASDDPEETELMFVLLTRDIGPQKNDVWGYEMLHGRRLKFLNRHRPSKRYLYFKAVMSLLRRRRAEVDGHWKDLDQLPAVAKTMWASPGTYLKNSILYRFSRELGCLTKEDANRFWEIDTEAKFAGLAIEDQTTATALAIQASNAVLGGSGCEDEAETKNTAEDDDDPFI